jgi:hypothetical protein
MKQLFESYNKFVIIFSTNHEENSENQSKHIKHRKIDTYVEEHFSNFNLIKVIENPSKKNRKEFADFFIYKLK